MLPCKGHNSWPSFRCQSTLGQYTTLQAMAFICLRPGCPECSCLRTAFLSFVGTTTWSANIRNSSMMNRKSLCHLNCWRSPVKSGGHVCLGNLWTFCIIGSRWVSHLISTLVTGIVWIQSVSVCWKSSSMLMAVMMVLSSGTDCELAKFYSLYGTVCRNRIPIRWLPSVVVD